MKKGAEYVYRVLHPFFMPNRFRSVFPNAPFANIQIHDIMVTVTKKSNILDNMYLLGAEKIDEA